MPRQAHSAERRRHPRVHATVPLQILAEGKEHSFDLVDLSESGARIRPTQSLPAMTRLQVRMVLPGKRIGSPSDVSLATTGVVVWSHRQPGGPAYDLGVFFADLDETQRNVLRAFVASHA